MSNVQPYTRVHLPCEARPNSQDQSSFLVGGDALQPLMGCLDKWIDYEQVIYLQETHDLDLSCNS